MKRSIAWGIAAFGFMNLILVMIAAGTHEWIYIRLEVIIFKFSIWGQTPNGETAAFNAIRAFMVLAALANATAVVFSAMLAHQSFKEKICAEIFYLATGVCLLIAVLVFSSEVSVYSGYFGYSFTLACVCIVFSFLLSVSVEVLSRYD